MICCKCGEWCHDWASYGGSRVLCKCCFGKVMPKLYMDKKFKAMNTQRLKLEVDLAMFTEEINKYKLTFALSVK